MPYFSQLKTEAMPIRMTPDEGRQDIGPGPRPNRPDIGGGGGGGGMLGSLLPLLIGFLFKNPKLLIVAAVLFGAYYFLGDGCAGAGGGGLTDVVSNLQTARGADLDPAVYDKAEVFEPLADNVKNPLPERVSMEQFAPRRLNQGQQGSCVAWASAYGARTIVQAEATKSDPEQYSVQSQLPLQPDQARQRLPRCLHFHCHGEHAGGRRAAPQQVRLHGRQLPENARQQ
jgi:hypothetical protein